MELEKLIQILIYIHAGFGGIALIAGLTSLIVKKGSLSHKKGGKIFIYSMLLSAILSLVIAVMPGHESLFLLSIGIFSIYLILSGYRSLKFKKERYNLHLDKIITWMMLIIGSAMVLYPLFSNNQLKYVPMVFGLVGLAFAFRDLKYYRNVDLLKKNWLRLHLGKMTGGYISAVTAFVVVNQIFPGYLGWILPGVIGTVYISFWTRKISPKKHIKA